MRKLILILGLAISAIGFATAGPPPSCGDNCPFVR